MNALLEQLSRFGVGRLIAMFGLTAGAAAALVFFTMSMNSNGQALLFSGLAPSDAAAVSERLDQAGISYELQEGGSAVYVSTSQVDEARMRVASGGALSFGSVGYEIFDETDALGTTSFVQNVNAKRALEGELARSINTLNSVTGTRVHLVLPERRLFSRDEQQPSASVVVSVRGEMSGTQIATIRNLVATAVPGLQVNRITLADDQGRLLAAPSDADGDMIGAMLDDRQTAIERDLQQKIRDLVEGVVGSGGVRVAVTAELNRQSQTRTRLEYDPNGQVEVSRRAEEQSRSEPVTSGGVSVSENTPDAEAGADGETPLMANSQSSITERNYQNTQEETVSIIQAGDLQRLAVSVVVDEVATVGEDGTLTFEPRSEAELTQIRNLVAAAVGFPTDTTLTDGEQILQVTSMRFNRPDLSLGTPAPEGFSLGSLDFMRIAEIVVLFITALLVILLVARPLVQGAIGNVSGGRTAALAGPGAMPENVQALLGNSEGGMMLPEEPSADDHIDVAQIEGQVKKSSVRKVAALVEQHPDESMSILRTWMHEGE
ncbi:flagellar basal-body MS-ring/collar protein FliF [Oceanicaulis sp.]|uniref:flagellar basal-body MS-ring/collar protein FliF n=1 Tax=Oceanicaulis sp. TaxID=1924941 RepID=UPI003F6FC08E